MSLLFKQARYLRRLEPPNPSCDWIIGFQYPLSGTVGRISLLRQLLRMLAGNTGDSMKRSIFHLPVAAILLLHAAPISPLNPPTPIEPIVHRPTVAPVPGPSKALEASVTAERVEPTLTPTPRPIAPATALSGSHTDWMAAAGIPKSDWTYVDFIITHESGWRVNAVNSSSGATGLCQSLPASKMASAGADYMTDPVTQLRWCHAYAMSRYKGWSNAYLFWQSHHWW